MATPRVDRLPRDFWNYLGAVALSNLGDGIRFGALPLLTASISRNPVAVAAVSGITMLPWFVFGAIGGAVVDRVDRQRLIIWTQLARAAAVWTLVAAILTDRVGLPIVYLVAFAIGLGEVLVDTASQAAIPLLAPAGALEQANSRMVGAQLATGEIIGLPVGALLFAWTSEAPFLVDACTFLVGALLIALVRRPLQGERTAPRQPIVADVRAGFDFLWHQPYLRRSAVALGLSNFAITASGSLFVLLIVDVLDAPEIAFGVLGAAGAVGGLIGSVIGRRLIATFGRSRAMVGGGVVGTLAQAATGLAPNVAAACACFFISTLAVVVGNVVGQSLRQTVTPEHLLGRVVASYRMIGLGGMPLGALAGGLMASATGVRSVFAFTLVVGSVAMVLLARALRWLPAHVLEGEPLVVTP
ncbi:MAG: MFS transporter [Ilumatobacteraceae bacterium]